MQGRANRSLRVYQLMFIAKRIHCHGTSSSAEACEDEASYYLAFELCTGGTLLEAIEDRYAGEWEDCVHATWTRSC